MTPDIPHHAQFNLEQTIGAPVSTVFQALSDPAARTRWGVPSDDEVLIYDAADFRVGGVDTFRCGPRAAPAFHGETCYLAIVPGHRIVAVDTVATGGQTLACALLTTEVLPDAAGTLLRLTVQLVSFVGPGMAAAQQGGHRAALASWRDDDRQRLTQGPIASLAHPW